MSAQIGTNIYRARPRKLPKSFGRGSGPEERAKKLKQLVTEFIRYERIESTLPKCDETRGYAEQLIYLAMEKGDKDRHAMEMADYWLLEKDMIHKLFKELVPRFRKYQNLEITRMYRLPSTYPGNLKTSMALLELKGNPWPAVLSGQRNKQFLLTNVLFNALYYDLKQEGKLDPYLSEGRALFPDEETDAEDEIGTNENTGDSVDDGTSVDGHGGSAKFSSTELSDSDDFTSSKQSVKLSEQQETVGTEGGIAPGTGDLVDEGSSVDGFSEKLNTTEQSNVGLDHTGGGYSPA